MAYEERGPGNRLSKLGEELPSVDLLLSQVYKLYVSPNGTDMDIVYSSMEQAAERLEALAKRVREWRG